MGLRGKGGGGNSRSFLSEKVVLLYRHKFEGVRLHPVLLVPQITVPPISDGPATYLAPPAAEMLTSSSFIIHFCIKIKMVIYGGPICRYMYKKDNETL